MIFDVYRDIPIKSAERELRGESDAITFKNLGRKHKSRETERQGTACNMWKPMLQDHCRESRGRRRAKIRTRGG